MSYAACVSANRVGAAWAGSTVEGGGVMRRLVALSLILVTGGWQGQWLAWASATQPSMPMRCPCRGTDACCCRNMAQTERSRALCHLPAQAPIKDGAFAWQPDRCGDRPGLLQPTAGPEALPVARASGAASQPSAWRAGTETSTRASVVRDPPDTPPRHSSVTA